jgi:integrase
LKNIFERRKSRIQPKPGDYVFAGKGGAPLNFPNLEYKVIKPALEKSKLLKRNSDGKWEKDDTTGINWRGYHGFRRGLASNLLAMGVHSKLIQPILRHSDIQTTLELYAMVPDNETREALQKLEAKFAVLGVT